MPRSADNDDARDAALTALVEALESVQRAFDKLAAAPADSEERDALRREAEALLESARAAVARVEALAADRR